MEADLPPEIKEILKKVAKTHIQIREKREIKTDEETEKRLSIIQKLKVGIYRNQPKHGSAEIADFLRMLSGEDLSSSYPKEVCDSIQVLRYYVKNKYFPGAPIFVDNKRIV